MKSQTVVTQILFIVLISAFMSTCRKDITTPNSESEKLFGKWTWRLTIGGISGASMFTPESEGYTRSIEYTDKGIYRIYKDGKLSDKMKFKLSAKENNSLLSNGIIEYNDVGLFDKNNTPTKQNLFLQGQDTLYLNDLCSDCFNYLYVREK